MYIYIRCRIIVAQSATEKARGTERGVTRREGTLMARPPKRPRRRNGTSEQQRPQQRWPSGTIDRHSSSSTVPQYHARHHRRWLACFIVCREQRGQGANKMDVLRGFGARGIRTRGVARRGATRIRLVNRGVKRIYASRV